MLILTVFHEPKTLLKNYFCKFKSTNKGFGLKKIIKTRLVVLQLDKKTFCGINLEFGQRDKNVTKIFSTFYRTVYYLSKGRKSSPTYKYFIPQKFPL